MHPVLFTLSLTPETARVLGFVAVFALSGILVFDAWRQDAKKRRALGIFGAVVFCIVGLGIASAFLHPRRLPEQVHIVVRTWGVLVFVGMVSCYSLQRWLGKQVGLTGDQISTIWVYGGVSALVGARVLHISVNWADYAHAPLTLFSIWDGGVAYIGGIIGASIYVIVYMRKVGLGARALDALILGPALTHWMGRMGCFMAGCCYGRPTDLPWGVSFPPDSLAQLTMVASGQIAAHAGTPHLHPTQLYEASLTLGIGLALFVWYRKAPPKPGMIFASYFLVYPVVRFLLELVRFDPEREFIFRVPNDDPLILSTSQGVGLLLIPVAIVLMRRFQRGAGLWPRAEQTVPTEKASRPSTS